MIEKYLNNRFFILYLIPFVLGSSTVFSYQPFNLTLINFFILPIFFYLIVYIKKKSKNTYRTKPYKKNLFIFGLAFGFGYYLFGIYWITHSLTFDESFKILIPFGLILIPLFLSLFFSLVTLIVGPFLNLNIISIFFLSGSLAFSDYLRAKVLTGFPWNLWAYSFSWATEIIQILNLIGLFAFNLISITIFMFPAVFFFNIKLSKKFLSLILLFFLLFFSYIYGNHSINKNQLFLKSNIDKFNIKVISPNFNLEYGLTPEEIEDRLKKLIRYSEPNKDLKTLFVWPEGVFSGYNFEEILEFKYIIEENFNKNHLILFGINTFDQEKNGLYNSMVIVDNRLEIIQQYKKQKLVPFGEFLPFKKILNNFGLKKITEGHGSFLKGNKQGNLIINQLNILPLICYEVIFTKFIQQSNLETNLIINISEDGWFGNTIGPHQHFAKGIFRAIEQNSFLIRSTNKGISAIINNKGQVVKKLNALEAGNIELEVPLIKSNNKNKNDLIFFALLFTYISFFKFYKKNNVKK
tara:strand:+ start:690 stop:2255 length:1566 start_codon:yes stop_codon:yes gene_type:complete